MNEENFKIGVSCCREWRTRPDSNGRPADSKSSLPFDEILSNPYIFNILSDSTPTSKREEFSCFSSLSGTKAGRVNCALF